MRRAVLSIRCLPTVLVLVGVVLWLSLANGGAAPSSHGASGITASARNGDSDELALVVSCRAVPVARAAASERLSVTAAFASAAASVSIDPGRLATTCGGDCFESLRRVQARRRVPRMNSDEPPWS